MEIPQRLVPDSGVEITAVGNLGRYAGITGVAALGQFSR